MIQIPEFLEDICIPSFITENYGEVDVDISVYFGPGGTISPLHYDPKHNLLAQVKFMYYMIIYCNNNMIHKTNFAILFLYIYERKETYLGNLL